MMLIVGIVLSLAAVVLGTAAVLLGVVIHAAARGNRVRALAALRWLVGYVASVALVIGAMMVYGSIRSRRPVLLPEPAGPYGVGRTTFDWADHSRADPLAPRPGESRRLCVWLWYPAARRPAAPRAPYRPGLADRSAGFAAPRNGVIRTHSVEQAPLSSKPPSYPVLVFAPGLGADAAAYTVLAEGLASQGYVVAAFNPTYSTEVRFPDGTVVPSIDSARDRADPAQIVNVWARDLRFVVDQLADLNRSSTNFQGRLDLSRVGFVGHSLGGAAAMEAGHADSRCLAVANLDGDPFGEVLAGGLRKPFLFVGHEGALAEFPTMAARLRQATRTAPENEATVLSVKGTRHFNFADRSIMASRYGIGRWLGFLGPIDGRRGLTITRATVTRFFDAFVREGAAFTPEDLPREYPEVTVEPLTAGPPRLSAASDAAQ